MMFVLILSFLFVLIKIAPAHAYLDLGTGTIIVQSIVGAIAAVGVWLKFNWGRVKEFCQKVMKKKSD